MIHLQTGITETLFDAAAAADPNEACGLLIGRRDGQRILVDRFAASDNLAAQPWRRFEIDPGLHIRLLRRLRGSAQDIVGLFHSHPKGSAEPSATDLAMASDSTLVWLIAGRDNVGGRALAAYQFCHSPRGFTRLQLITDEGRI